jgi:hypothetical protein
MVQMMTRVILATIIFYFGGVTFFSGKKRGAS